MLCSQVLTREQKGKDLRDSGFCFEFESMQRSRAVLKREGCGRKPKSLNTSATYQL